MFSIVTCGVCGFTWVFDGNPNFDCPKCLAATLSQQLGRVQTPLPEQVSHVAIRDKLQNSLKGIVDINQRAGFKAALKIVFKELPEDGGSE